MPLSIDDLTGIERVLASPDAASLAFAELRRQFPHLAWTRCEASDVVEEPFRSYPHFDIHLLDGASYCVEITSDPARATGIVLARRSAAS